MATRSAAASLLLFGLAASGCGKVATCTPHTVLVSVVLDSSSASADALSVDIVIDGATKTSPLPHQAGSNHGSIEVRFPAGYPAGQSVTVRVSALSSGAVIGIGQTTRMLSSSCAAVEVHVNAANLTADLSLPAIDLAGLDLTLAQDLAAVDQASSGPPDLMCPTTVEDCFNGVDDNCDGLVDCADPQCNGTIGPRLADCVPDPAGAPAGFVAASCASPFPSPQPLHSGLTPGSCTTGSCACASGINGPAVCSGTFIQHSTASTSCLTLLGSTTIFNTDSSVGCITFSSSTDTSDYYSLSLPTFASSCFPPSGGTPTNTPPGWTSTTQFCSSSAVGGGCSAGQICVPTAPKHCVLEIGDQVACNVAGYGVMDTTAYSTGFDDSGRSCSCTCTPPTCPTVASFYNASNCLVPPAALGAGCTNGLSYNHASINNPSSTTCAPGASESGSTSTAAFDRTVCCTN